MIKRLIGCIGEYKKDSILTPIFVILEVLMEVMIPMLMAYLIDYGIGGENLTAIAEAGACLILAAAVSLFFGTLAGKRAAVVSCGFAANLRKQMYHNVQELSFSNLDKFSTASVITRLTTDVTNVQNSYQMIIRIAVRCPVMLILSLVMAVGINLKLSLIFLGAIPFLGMGLYLIISKAYPIFQRVFRIYDKLNNMVQENLRGIRVVKSFVRETHEEEKFTDISGDIYKNYSAAEKILALNSPLMQFAMYTCMMLISWFGAKLIVFSEMTTGKLVSLISYTLQILMSLMMLSMVIVMITISRASAERIAELLAEKSNLKNGVNPIYQVKNGDVSFQNVSFRYKEDADELCLAHVDLDISAGMTVGIIGGTGSSKTSLVQLIPRLYDVFEGSVSVGGEDVRKYDIKTLRDEVAVVLQKNELFSGTIKENLRWGNENASDEELVRVCRLAQADDFIKSFSDGYDTHIEQGGSNVSGGQKQRLCIARALLKTPKVLILDDSTSAVDTKTDAMIRKALREELPDTTKFIIAQRISSIEDADHIIVMDSGRIHGIGTHEQLLSENSIYREVYDSQTKTGGEGHDQ